MICPHCGKTFPHNCGSQLAARNKGVTSERKRLASRANAEKARAKLAQRKEPDIDLEPIDLTGD